MFLGVRACPRGDMSLRCGSEALSSHTRLYTCARASTRVELLGELDSQCIDHMRVHKSIWSQYTSHIGGPEAIGDIDEICGAAELAKEKVPGSVRSDV